MILSVKFVMLDREEVGEFLDTQSFVGWFSVKAAFSAVVIRGGLMFRRMLRASMDDFR